MMNPRRALLHVLALAPLAGARPVAAQNSGRIIRILVGFPPGQATDQVARLIAERLGNALAQPVIVENRPGQGGSTALAQVVRATPDGTTLTLSALAGYVVNPFLYANVGYDSTRDLAPIALVADLPMALVAHPSVPVNSFAELLAFVRANPERLAHSSSGSGTLSHLMMEDLKRRADIRMLHVPYPGSPKAMIDLMAGNVQIGLDTLTVTLPQVRAGKVKLLAFGTRQRLAEFPEVPTIAESGFPGFEAVAWIALSGPAGTPRELRERINAEVNKALREAEFVGKLHSIGALPRGGSIDELATFMASEQQRWKHVVAQSGAKAE